MENAQQRLRRKQQWYTDRRKELEVRQLTEYHKGQLHRSALKQVIETHKHMETCSGTHGATATCNFLFQ